jgi:hypothetical protein
MRIEQAGVTEPTLDADASQIVAEKKAAHFTDKGSLGYLPMIGHLAEADVIVHDEFRAGSVAPASDNLVYCAINMGLISPLATLRETLKKSASGRKRKAHGAQRPRHIK